MSTPPGAPAPTVYLAGPTLFEPGHEAVYNAMKQTCAGFGLLGLSPLDNQIELEGAAPGRHLAHQIVAADIELMHQADAGVFCLDGFRRGPEMDPGTAFEIGYMHALGKPLAGWTSDTRDYPERVQAFFATTFGLALTTEAGLVRDADGVLVHSEGCKQNIMCEIGIERSGGAVHADPAWAVAFAAAIADLAARLLRG